MSNYVIALDVGERRIGVALTSVIARLPAPFTTIDRNLVPDAFTEISNLVKQQDVGIVVVGLPRGLEGQETAQTKINREFATELEKHLSVPVVLQDEAGTSVEAEALLKSYGKNYTKADIDAQSATIILRDYLSQVEEYTA